MAEVTDLDSVEVHQNTLKKQQVKEAGKAKYTAVNLDHVFYYKMHGVHHPDLRAANLLNKRTAVCHSACGFVVKGNDLYYTKRGKERRVLLTCEERRQKFVECHSGPIGGHHGITATRSKIAEVYFWTGMHVDIANWVKHCDACQRTRHANIQAPALRPIKTTDCWEIIGMDLVGPMAETSSGNKYMCVFTDLFSKFVMARAIPSKEASSVARALTSVVLHYGAPKRIITDQGREFNNELNAEVFQTLGIQHNTTAPYHPQANGQVERTNQNIKNMLRKFCKEPEDWEEHLQTIVYCINTCKQSTTKFTPYEVLFKRVHHTADVIDKDPQAPVEADTDHINLDDYMECEMRRVEELNGKVKANIEKVQANMKKVYDGKKKKGCKSVTYKAGDLVLRKSMKKKQSGSVPTWSGPFEISSITKTMAILEEDGVRLKAKVPLLQLKPYHQPITEPMTSHQHDHGSYCTNTLSNKPKVNKTNLPCDDRAVTIPRHAVKRKMIGDIDADKSVKMMKLLKVEASSKPTSVHKTHTEPAKKKTFHDDPTAFDIFGNELMEYVPPIVIKSKPTGAVTTETTTSSRTATIMAGSQLKDNPTPGLGAIKTASQAFSLTPHLTQKPDVADLSPAPLLQRCQQRLNNTTNVQVTIQETTDAAVVDTSDDTSDEENGPSDIPMDIDSKVTDMVARKRNLLAATRELTDAPEVFHNLYVKCFLKGYHPARRTVSAIREADNIIHQHMTLNYPYSLHVVMKQLMKRPHPQKQRAQHISALQLMADLTVVGVLIGATSSSVSDLLYNYSIPKFVNKEIWLAAHIKMARVEVEELCVLEMTLKEKEVGSLFYQQWVYDKVLDVYLQLSTQLCKTTKCFAFAACQKKLLEIYDQTGDYEDLTAYQLIFMPIIVNKSHWVLVVGDTRTHEMSLYDSLGVYGPNYMFNTFKNFMAARNIGKETRWKEVHVKSPRQTDGDSCGIFVLMIADALMANAKPTVLENFHAFQYRPYMHERLRLQK